MAGQTTAIQKRQPHGKQSAQARIRSRAEEPIRPGRFGGSQRGTKRSAAGMVSSTIPPEASTARRPDLQGQAEGVRDAQGWQSQSQRDERVANLEQRGLRSGDARIFGLVSWLAFGHCWPFISLFWIYQI